jgi:hypothetical protein
MDVPQKTKIELLYNPVTPLLGINLKECAPRCDRATVDSCFFSTIPIIELGKQPRCPRTDEWIKKI